MKLLKFICIGAGVIVGIAVVTLLVTSGLGVITYQLFGDPFATPTLYEYAALGVVALGVLAVVLAMLGICAAVGAGFVYSNRNAKLDAECEEKCKEKTQPHG